MYMYDPFIYIYMCTILRLYTCIVYIYRERQRGREIDIERERHVGVPNGIHGFNSGAGPMRGGSFQNCSKDCRLSLNLIACLLGGVCGGEIAGGFAYFKYFLLAGEILSNPCRIASSP